MYIRTQRALAVGVSGSLKWVDNYDFYIAEHVQVKMQHIATIPTEWLTTQTYNDYFKPIATGNGTVEFPPKTLLPIIKRYFAEDGSVKFDVLKTAKTADITTFPPDIQNIISIANTQNITHFTLT